MIALAFIRAHWRFIVPAILVVIIAMQGMHVRALKAERVNTKAELVATKAAFSEAERLRTVEQAQDKGSFSDQSERCEQRVTTARDAARIIEDITNGTGTHTSHARTNGANTQSSHVPGGADAAGIVGADRLRIIAGQGGPAQAAGVPAGADHSSP